MSCNKCETKKCSCGKGSTPVMPPSECNTPTCPTPAPCSEIVPAACVRYTGEAKLCGEDDEVFAEGDTIDVIEGKIVDYFTLIITEGIKKGEFKKTDPKKSSLTMVGYLEKTKQYNIKLEKNWFDFLIR